MDFFGNTTPGSQMPMQNETYQPTENAAVQEEKKAPQRNPFAIWEVGGETYRLKLQTAGVKELEAKYKGSIMELMSFKGERGTAACQREVGTTDRRGSTDAGTAGCCRKSD